MKFLDEIGLSYFISKLKAILGEKADKSYVDNRVKTEVPLDAKFTETRINNKTGDISKEDIVALGVPAQDTIVDISGKQDKLTVGENISIVNNKISATDTIYTHPNTHPASMIIESALKRFSSDTEKTKWDKVTDKADKTYVDDELDKKEDKLGYSPLDKAGDTMTGSLTIAGNILSTRFKSDSWAFINHYTGGGWARGLLEVESNAKTRQLQIGIHGNGQTLNRLYIGTAYNNWAMELYPATKRTNFSGRLEYEGKEVATKEDVPTSFTWGDLKGV